MRSIVPLLIASLAACAYGPICPRTAVSNASPIPYGSVVALTRRVDGEPRPYCAGAWLSSLIFVTANHCIEEDNDAIEYSVHSDALDGSNVREHVTVRLGSVLSRDAAHDLVLVGVARAPDHASFAIGDPRVGAHATSIGHPLGLWYSFTEGTVSALRTMPLDDMPNALWVQAAVPTSRGNSGGPLIQDGRLVGIAHAVTLGGQLINWFIHSSYVKALYDAHLKSSHDALR